MEDVGFMTENGETESHVIFVDSSARDTVAYPNPASYVIPFDAPLKNVIGVDVLDSVIPATMYVIDTHNYDVRFYAIATNSTVPLHAVLQPHLTSYFKWWMELETQPGLDSYDPDTSSVTNIGSLDVLDMRLAASYPTPPVITEPFVDVVGAPNFQRVMAVRPIAQYVAGSGATPAGFTLGTYKAINYWLPAAFGYGTERTIIDDENDQVVLVTLARKATSSSALPFACHKVQYPSGNFGTYALFLTAGSSGGGGTVAATTDTTPTGTPYLTSVSTDPDRLQLAQISATVWANFLGGDTAFMAWDMTCGMTRVLGFLGSLGDPGLLTLQPRTNQARKQFYTNQVDKGMPTAYLSPTGLINLTGERYIILRCAEVEAGMFDQAVTGSLSTGIGLFKLPVPGSLREQRQDYVSVNKRPFHPIGRLDQLTIQLERGTLPGTLYNFKGIDHLMVIVVKVLVPKRLGRAASSQLNPNYDPDFLRYSIRYRLRDRGLPGRHEPIRKLDVERAMRRHELLTARDDPLDRVWPPPDVDRRYRGDPSREEETEEQTDDEQTGETSDEDGQ